MSLEHTGDLNLKRRPKNPLSLVVKMWEKNNEITPEEAFPSFKARVVKDEDYLDEVIMYYLINMLRNLNSDTPPPRKEFTVKQLGAMADSALGELMAAMILPTGKTVLKSLGSELRTVSNWGRALADAAGDNNIIGDKLNLTEIGKICKECK